MASFTLIRELVECQRDKGTKRILVALYETDTGSRYLACSEQKRRTEEDPWQSALKGITIRKSEVEAVIKGLQSADFDASSDTGDMTCQEYAKTLDWSVAVPGRDYNPPPKP